ncbi:flagellar hook-length control protein FliK [Marinomonas sp.]
MRTASNLLLPVSAETPKNLSKSISTDGQGQGSFADDLRQAKVDQDLKEQSKLSAASSESGTRPSNPKSESSQLSSTSSTSKEILNTTQTVNAQTVSTQPNQDSESLTAKQSTVLAPAAPAQLTEPEGVLVSSNETVTPANDLLLSESTSGNKLQSLGTIDPQLEEGAAVLSGVGLASTVDKNTDGGELVGKTLLSSSAQTSSPEQAPIESKDLISATQSLTDVGSTKELVNTLPVSEENFVSKPIDGIAEGAVSEQKPKTQAQSLNLNSTQGSFQQTPLAEQIDLANTSPQSESTVLRSGVNPPIQTPLAEQIDLANTSSQGESIVLHSGVNPRIQVPEPVTDVSSDEAKAALLASSTGLTAVVKKQSDESVATGMPSSESETNSAGLRSAKESSSSLLADQEALPKTTEGASFAELDGLKSSELAQTDTTDSLPIMDNKLTDGDKNQSSIDLSQALLASTMKATKADAGGVEPKATLSTDQNVITPQGTLVEPPAEDGVAWVMSQMQATQARPSMSKANSIEGDGRPLLADATQKTVLESPSTKTTLATEGVSLLSDGLSESSTVDATEFEVESDGMLEEFVAKDPVELRKKEQDALITRMSTTVERAANDAGGLGSSLQTGQMAKAAPAGFTAGAGANATAPTAQNLAMNLPPQHPGWAGEMTQKVAWVARDGGQSAHIRLDPPELGSLTVKISIDKDAATQVSFVAATPQARDMIEGQMHRLREMLAQQGMELNQVNVDVSQHDPSGSQFADAQDQQNNSSAGSSGGLDDADMALTAENVSYVSATGVDYYA